MNRILPIAALALACLVTPAGIVLAADTGAGGSPAGATSTEPTVTKPKVVKPKAASAAKPARKSVRPKPKERDDALARADLLIKRGRYQAGLDILAAMPSKTADALNLMGFANRKLGHLETARTYYDQALAADPNHIGALEYYGELLVQTGDLPRAKSFLARIEKLCPTCEERADLAGAISRTAGN